MIRAIIVLGFLLLVGTTIAQPVEVQVLGRINYTETPEGYGVEIKMVENPNKCDPVTGFLRLEDQKIYLLNNLEAAKVNKVELTEIKKVSFSEFPEAYYKIEETDKDKFEEILNICRQSSVEILEIYYKYIPHQLEMEDEKALLAFYDAERKAKAIANHLKMPIVKLVSIDDDTSAANNPFYDPNSRYSKEEQAIMVSMLSNMLAGGDSQMYGGKGKKDKKEKSYTILVTFEISD